MTNKIRWIDWKRKGLLDCKRERLNRKEERQAMMDALVAIAGVIAKAFMTDSKQKWKWLTSKKKEAVLKTKSHALPKNGKVPVQTANFFPLKTKHL